jgi:hypothetical protein
MKKIILFITMFTTLTLALVLLLTMFKRVFNLLKIKRLILDHKPI